MTAPIELNIRFGGRTAGSSSHSLSVLSFQSALRKLFSALRQTAEGVAKGLVHQPNGRHGRQFDLQLASLSGEGVTFKLVWAPMLSEDPAEQRMQEHLAKNTVETFLESLNKEWTGTDPGVNSVRRFLSAIPEGVSTQEYEAKVDNEVVRRLVLDARTATDRAQEWRQFVPRLKTVLGNVESIRFDKTSGRVRLREANGLAHNCSATSEVIDRAVSLYKDTVVCKILIRPDMKELLAIRSQQESEQPPSQDDRLRHLYSRWQRTLDKLAE